MTDWIDVERRGSAWREMGSANGAAHGPAGGPAQPPLVFLHGLGGSRESWNPQLRAFSPSRRCLAWDMPGYGASSPAPPGRLSYDLIADRLVSFLDDAEVDRADVVGLSFGGMHALHTALRYPDRLRRLVLADTSPAFGMNGTRADDWIAARLAPLDNGASLRDIAPVVLDSIVARPLHDHIRRDLIAAFSRIGEPGFRAAVQCLPDHDLRERLHQITHPSLVLVGELDEETPPSYAQVLADGLPNSELIVLCGVGHLSPSEDPAGFNRHVERFLTEPERRPPPPDGAL